MRRLEDHIGPEELASLTENLEVTGSEQTNPQIISHLSLCQQCSELVEAHRKLRGLNALEFPMSESCPPQLIWLEFAEGLRAEQTQSLLDHAAQCHACAALLKESLSLMQPEDPEVPIADLESSTHAWQQRMAAQLATSSLRAPATRERSTYFSRVIAWNLWISVPSAAVIIAIIATAGLSLWRFANPSEARLLALAYNEQRTLALRIPGGDPVPMASGTRGPGAVPSPPVALLELRVRAQKHLEKTPNSPYWHQVLGEVDLLEGDGLSARNNLEIAQSSDANLPNLLPDLAAAWFEIGDKTGSAEAFAEATERYSQQIRASNRDASLLYYNRGLCWERQGVLEKALEDLQTAFTIEPSQKWRKAIQSEIARLSVSSSPAHQVSRRTTDGTSSSSLSETVNYEDALDEATTQLLPRWEPDPTVRRRLAQTAAIGLTHGDSWLRDWISFKHTTKTAEADKQLAAAAVAAKGGNAQASLSASKSAVVLYRSSGDHPGLMRAELAQVYALQRLDRAGECLHLAEKLSREPGIERYAWIHAQLKLEEGSCRFLVGDYESAKRAFDTVVASTTQTRLNWLRLRALGGQAQILEFRGSPISSWQVNSEALRICAETHCPPIREYLLIYNMVRGAEDLGLPYVAMELMRTGERLAAASGDATTHAYAVENLALIAGRIGNFDESDRAFTQLSEAAPSNKTNTSVELYRAEWQTDRAEILIRRGAPAAALNLLRQSELTLLSSDYQRGRLHYFVRNSDALFATGDLEGAFTSATAAVHEAEKTLPSLRSILEKEQWQRENAAPYAQLIKVCRWQNKDAEAWQIWARYRALAYGVAPEEADKASRLTSVSQKNSLTAPGPRVLVFALIDDSYVGWLLSTQPLRVLRTATLGDRNRVHQQVTTFYHLCSDRDSTLSDVRIAGDSLYAALFRPFADVLASSSQLWFDLDPSLSAISIPALTLPSGEWLGVSREISILPGWWTLRPEILSDGAPLSLTARALIVNGFERNRETYSEASAIARLFPNSTLLQGASAIPQRMEEALSTAELFHFSGHASSESGSTRLLLPSGGDQQPGFGVESVYRLHLDHCRIAVLAACNTTASNPRRIEPSPDLRNEFLQSGVHTVIASQWDVDDRSTDALMNAFYRQLASGDSAAHALQTAQVSIQSDQRWQHPFYWASFQLFAN